jgi:hypothetical protein
MIQKYAAAFLTLAVTVLTAISVLPDPTITLDVALQLGLLTVGTIGTLFLPLLQGAWAGGLKTGINIFTALLSALVPLTGYINSGKFETAQLILVLIAVLNAVLSELGVYTRLDQAKVYVAKHAVNGATDAPASFVDPVAVETLAPRH